MSPSQPSDKLRDILHRARERSALAPPVPAAQERAQGQASVESLLDKSQPLPDPRALARLYQEQALAQLPEESDDAPPAAPTTPGWSDLPPPAPAPGTAAQFQAASAAQFPAPSQPDPVSAQPTMSPAELRAVMSSLQEKFSGSTYRIYDVPSTAAADDFSAGVAQQIEDEERAELARLKKEARNSNLMSLLGAVLVIVIIGGFIYLATGPLKGKPTPTVSPSVAASP